MNGRRSSWPVRLEAATLGLLLLLPVVIQLAGCADAVDGVAPADRAAAEAFVSADQAPLSVRPVALWYALGRADGMMCGEIEAPEALKDTRSTLRYIIDPDTGVQQVEMHELWVARGALSAAIVQANRNIFDNLWTNYCAPYAPFSRRVARWFGA